MKLKIKSSILVLLIIGVFVATFVFVFISRSKKEITNNYMMSEVSTHSDAVSCWMVIGGKVYDVTKFTSMHKGGDKILMGCGKDATDLFNKNPKHKDQAQIVLKSLQIGILVGS